jgi:hypothetical protein
VLTPAEVEGRRRGQDPGKNLRSADGLLTMDGAPIHGAGQGTVAKRIVRTCVRASSGSPYAAFQRALSRGQHRLSPSSASAASDSSSSSSARRCVGRRQNRASATSCASFNRGRPAPALAPPCPSERWCVRAATARTRQMAAPDRRRQGFPQAHEPHAGCRGFRAASMSPPAAVEPRRLAYRRCW